MLRYLTAGESHGPALTAIVEGFPSGVAFDSDFIDRELKRRQGGYGRGKRQTLETDRIIVDSGTYHGVTTGAPITLRLVNNDAKLERLTEPASPRGGHIDFAGHAINYQTGIRQVLERASARRNKRFRVAVGAYEALLGARAGNQVSLAMFARLGESTHLRSHTTWRWRREPRLYPESLRHRRKNRRGYRCRESIRRHARGLVETVVEGCPHRPGKPIAAPGPPDARLAPCRNERTSDQGRRDRPWGRGRPSAGIAGDGLDCIRARPPR